MTNDADETDQKTVVPTARDRWKILRQAILRSQQGKENHVPGLHSFPGYQLLARRQRPQPTLNKDTSPEDWMKVMQQSFCQVMMYGETYSVDHISGGSVSLSLESLLQILEDSYWGYRALCNTKGNDENKHNKTGNLDAQATLSLQLSMLAEDRRAQENNDTAHTALHEFWLTHTTELLQKHKEELENQLKERLQLDSCQLCMDSAGNHKDKLIQLHLQTTRAAGIAQDAYEVQAYGFSSSSSTSVQTDANPLLYTRERMSRQHFSLQELMNTKNDGNNNDVGVDNTGNVCIWDSEKTLSWSVARHFLTNGKQEESASTIQPKNVGVVLELGIGMAGLAGLLLAQSGMAKRVILTDGHEKCVQNNRINVRLQQAAYQAESTVSSSIKAKPCPVSCQLLQWTVEPDAIPSSLLDCADLTLISDCTHFEHYHGHLLWTLLSCTKSFGEVWMCQPDRGQSWQRFCNLMDAVNQASGDVGPLVRLREQRFSELEDLHQKFLTDKTSSGASFYRPNVHRPRIMVLSKLRSVSEQDRQAILQHLAERDQTY